MHLIILIGQMKESYIQKCSLVRQGNTVVIDGLESLSERPKNPLHPFKHNPIND